MVVDEPFPILIATIEFKLHSELFAHAIALAHPTVQKVNCSRHQAWDVGHAGGIHRRCLLGLGLGPKTRIPGRDEI
jgi:hypothetical protein